jgi:long-chain acyl-CoA synthetase
VRKDADGNYFIVDRKNDMIVTGGINVYPVEIENVIMTHDAVDDVAVIGVPDDKWGKAVKALVVKAAHQDLDAAALIAFCHEKLAGFKVPKSVEFIDQIPRSMVGKALKSKLREKYGQGRKAV